jgi:hypothetical protein
LAPTGLTAFEHFTPLLTDAVEEVGGETGGGPSWAFAGSMCHRFRGSGAVTHQTHI